MVGVARPQARSGALGSTQLLRRELGDMDPDNRSAELLFQVGRRPPQPADEPRPAIPRCAAGRNRVYTH